MDYFLTDNWFRSAPLQMMGEQPFWKGFLKPKAWDSAIKNIYPQFTFMPAHRVQVHYSDHVLLI